MSEVEAPPPTQTQEDVIVCRVTPWYFWRMAKAGAFLVAFGLYFFYDGIVGYPKANKKADDYEWFQKSYLKSYEEAKASGTLAQWIAKNEAAGNPVGENDEPPKWVTYAAQRGWSEEVPKKYSEADIAQQYHWGWGMFIVAGGLGVWTLLNRNKTLVGHPDHMVMPNGRQVRYADAFKVDKRKWEYKGLAYVHFKHEGRQGRVTVDDLKYQGADRVLARLQEHFSGELVEKAPDVEEEGDGSPSPPTAPTPPA